MVKLTYVEFGGREKVVDVEPGQSIMQGAVQNSVLGILADCGGSCSCATCHIYVDPEWVDKLPPKDENEESMLECVMDPQPNSRLSCQIQVTGELDGLVIRLPQKQV